MPGLVGAIMILNITLGSLGAAADSKAGAIANAETVAYCDLLRDPRAFADKIIRVRALYQANFEQWALTAPSCAARMPMTWVDFESSWETRTSWRIRRAIMGVKWGIQTDVVLVGKFKTGKSFGHNGMYPFEG